MMNETFKYIAVVVLPLLAFTIVAFIVNHKPKRTKPKKGKNKRK